MKLLVVDDDPKLRAFLSRGLAESGFECELAASGEEAKQRLAAADPPIDLMLLDVMMPDGDGWDVLAHVRSEGPPVPVIFVTARHSVEERIRGLELGADDYVIKPFEFGELVARIHAVARRHQERATYELGDLVLDPLRRTIERGGRRVEVGGREFDLLRELLERPGEVRSRPDLLAKVWGIDFDPGTNVVDVAIARLRRKLEAGSTPLIHTVVGQGYCLSTAPPGAGESGRVGAR